MNIETTLLEIKKLQPEERLALATDIWNSIAEENILPVSSYEKDILDKRIERHNSFPDEVTDWKTMKQGLLNEVQSKSSL